MSIFDKAQTAETSPKQEYKFITSDINDFMQDFNRPKQEMPESAVSFDNFPVDEPDNIERDETETLKVNAQVARSTARLIVAAIDGFVPEIMRTIAKEETSEAFRADADSKSELEKAFAEYIKLKGVGDIPPGVMILVLLVVTYGSKVPMIMQLRKANMQRDADRREIEALQAEILKLKEQHSDGKSGKTDDNTRH